MEYNIIGDVAGRYYELLELVAKMPQDAHIILVGDLMDRGPKSKQVIQWAIDNKDRVTCLYGNHEDMMVRSYRGVYDVDNWQWNGGGFTLLSYDPEESGTVGEAMRMIPKEHVEFLESLPRYFLSEGLLVTHVPYRGQHDLAGIEEQSKDEDFIWNRHAPGYRPGLFQVYGHNSSFNGFELVDSATGQLDLYAICIDDSRHKQLLGIHYPSKQLYNVAYKEAL